MSVEQGHTHVIPTNAAHYHGRAEVVDATGEVTATLWEQPGGQEWIATIAPEHLGGQVVHPGARLVVDTWYDASGQGHVHVEVHNRVLTDDEKREVYALAAELMSGGVA